MSTILGEQYHQRESIATLNHDQIKGDLYIKLLLWWKMLFFFRFQYKTTKIKKYTYQKYISGVLVLQEVNFCSFWGKQNTNELASLFWTK